ncbi:MAG: methyltransferase [Albidovulum sp.]
MFEDSDLTCDRFLGGRLQILQPRAGYRAATDPVLLAAAVQARAGQSVLELGCGAGVASLCLATRVPGLLLCGVERQPAYADLARRNGAANGIALNVIEADLSALPAEIRAQSFDHVLANPPYFSAGEGTRAKDQGREAALREQTPLADWVTVALKRLRPDGWVTMIHLAERLPALLGALCGKAGSITILPVAAREGREASRVIVRARKGGRASARLLAPLVIHDGPAHQRDGDDYSAIAREILRDGAPIPGLD